MKGVIGYSVMLCLASLLLSGCVVSKRTWSEEDTGIRSALRYGSALSDATIRAAITTIGSDKADLLVTPGTWSIANSLTVPNNISLWIAAGATLDVAGGKTLSLNGPLSATPQQIFSGSGTVRFGTGSVKEVLSEWWGAKPDGATDDTTAMQAALNAYTTDGAHHSTLGTVRLLSGTYNIRASLQLNSRVALVGSGLDVTVIQGNGTNFALLVSSGVTEVVLANLTVQNKPGSGRVGVGLDVASGTTSNLYIDRVYFQQLTNGIRIRSNLVHSEIARAQFNYNSSDSVQLASGAVINSILFRAVRFEQSNASAYRSLLSGVTHGGVTFLNCVFESLGAQYAVDLGGNAAQYRFLNTHFENNGGHYMNGRDVYIGAGGRGIYFQGNVFSNGSDNSRNFYSVEADSNVREIKFDTNTIGANSPSYRGLFYQRDPGARPGAIFIANHYTPSQRNVDVAQSIHIGERAFDSGWHNGPVFKEMTTTDATPTVLWQHTWMSTDGGTHRAYSVIAHVTAISDDGSEYASYTRRILVTHTGTGAPISRGAADEADTQSAASLHCAFAVSADNQGTLQLKVTGVAGRTIKWAGTIYVVHVRS